MTTKEAGLWTGNPSGPELHTSYGPETLRRIRLEQSGLVARTIPLVTSEALHNEHEKTTPNPAPAYVLPDWQR